jgi:hypothetical protein
LSGGRCHDNDIVDLDNKVPFNLLGASLGAIKDRICHEILLIN